ncbi:MAG: hypothetical protein K0R89_2731 [Ramlibacter sp.]|jgi:hypothetical protein|nr:hypothetical protein [Ramlibacter sp.]MCD6078787.1 hypothetical protein [Ramlibacter sp.]
MHRPPARTFERTGWSWIFAFVLLVCGSAAAWAQVTPAEVTQLQVERTEDGVLLSAAVRFELPQAVDDALAKGIPMFFVAEATILRDRWYWYDKRVAHATRHMRLAFQPLTRRWRLQVSSSPIGNSGLVLGQMFDTRDEALAAVQRISRWRIAEPGEVDPEGTHNVDFRFRLDVSQLPRPFQIGAVGQADWYILAVRTQRLAFEQPK